MRNVPETHPNVGTLLKLLKLEKLKLLKIKLLYSMDLKVGNLLVGISVSAIDREFVSYQIQRLFLVVCTQLNTPLCQLVGRLVGWLVRHLSFWRFPGIFCITTHAQWHANSSAFTLEKGSFKKSVSETKGPSEVRFVAL